ncbi:MAG: hypothetical protein VB031_09400 [Eubacteriaceae bacterium]|nr:hypothetical protein [Eubacteriaceae bacterium]
MTFVKILLCTSFLFGAYYVLLNAIQAVGAATESLIMNMSRQGIILYFRCIRHKFRTG